MLQQQMSNKLKNKNQWTIETILTKLNHEADPNEPNKTLTRMYVKSHSHSYQTLSSWRFVITDVIVTQEQPFIQHIFCETADACSGAFHQSHRHII